MKDISLDYSRYFWQGEKTRLRPLRAEDAELHFINCLDSPARQILQSGIELPTSVELLKGSLEKYFGCKDADGVILFVVESLAGENVGGLSLHSRDEKNGTFSFGVAIRRSCWGQGYATDAVRIILRYGFWECRYQKCDSACLHINAGSIKLHQKLGFVEEGRLRRQAFYNGEYYDTVLFGLTREEFDAREKEASVERTSKSSSS